MRLSKHQGKIMRYLISLNLNLLDIIFLFYHYIFRHGWLLFAWIQYYY